MKLVSLNCGLPREVRWRGQNVTTSIYKEPLVGRVPLRTLNLDGDRQSDLSVHGGKDKAVYCYSIEHYEFWKTELLDRTLTMGAFGENFTVEGMLEDSVCIGDRFAIGTAEVVVTQPRLPCYKLGIRFESDDMVRRFLASRRTGFYLAVTREGEVAASDEIVPLGGDPGSISVSQIFRLYLAKEYDGEDIAQVRRVLMVRTLPESWKEYFQGKLDRQAL
jgi:MOSC domain-containing protein YiiM